MDLLASRWLRSAAGAAHLPTIMLLLILASVGTFLHTGLKLPYFTWFGEKKGDFSVSDVPLNMKIAMGMGAFFCTLFGIFPGLLYSYLPYPVDYTPYTVYHFVEMLQILVFTFVGFWLLRKKLEGSPHIALDTDWFYRKPADAVQKAFVQMPNKLFGLAETASLNIAEKVSGWSTNPIQYLLPSFVNSNRPLKSDDFAAPIGTAIAFILFGFITMSLILLI
ncbi:MAG: hypothetical protein U5J63_07050 [Fodinibius sp.]|nr:hypothetical protein [Fodinibius sp.]